MLAVKNKKEHSSVGDKMRKDIISKIKAGELKPGEALLSTQKLAELYQISLVTAHLVLKELTEKNVLVRKKGKGTFIAERNKKSSLTKLGVPVYLQNNPFHVEMIEEISEQAMKCGTALLLGRACNEFDFYEKLLKNNVPAVIRYPNLIAREPEVWNLLMEKNIKPVIINDFWLNGGPFPCVRTDEEHGVEAIMEHLISLGYKKIILLDEEESERRLGFFNAYYKILLKHGIPFDPSLVKYIHNYGGFSISRDLVEDLLKTGTAVVTVYDKYAINIIEHLKDMGLQAGSDLSVTGFDGVYESENFGLTTVKQPIKEIVENAFRILNFPHDVPEKIQLKPACLFRSSTGAPTKEKNK